MSNLEPHPDEAVLDPGQPCTAIEVLEPREVPLGGPRAMTVYRTLPQRRRSLVGAWCFLDHYGPDDVASTGGMVVPRHPHTGLATVSWLFEGRIDHLDSGGNSAQVRPGELNLMVAGRGITHQEISTADTKALHGVQLWFALPDARRFDPNDFIHYVPPVLDGDGYRAQVFIGELLGSVSPAQFEPGLLGAQLTLDAGSRVGIDIDPAFEHCVLAETGSVTVNGHDVEHRSLAYVPTGSSRLELTANDVDGARVILLGGVPFGEEIVMWWNFVGRSHDEVAEFRRRYQVELGFEAAPDGITDDEEPLFGDFPPGQRDPLPAPALPNARLRPRT